MKKSLLYLFLLLCSSGIAQVLQSENFNALTVGNVGTDITGATAGQGGWSTFSTNNGPAGTTTNSINSSNSNFRVVSNGFASSNGLEIESGEGNYGSRFMWKEGLDTSWGSRTSGNDIIEVEYSFFTGPTTTSRTQVGMRIYGLDNSTTPPSTRTLNGFVYTTNTRVLSGVCYLNNGGTPGTFTITLQTGELILNENTWYTIGCSYNTTTGETLWKTSPTAAVSSLPAATRIPNLVPVEVDFVSIVVGPNPTSTPPVPANTIASSIIFDNYISRASSTNTLLSLEESIKVDSFLIYPNPTSSILNISNPNSVEIKNISVVDINGRIVKNQSDSLSQINVSDLNAGVYFVTIEAAEGKTTKKFIKQ
jgi:hypothetical protein